MKPLNRYIIDLLNRSNVESLNRLTVESLNRYTIESACQGAPITIQWSSNGSAIQRPDSTAQRFDDLTI